MSVVLFYRTRKPPHPQPVHTRETKKHRFEMPRKKKRKKEKEERTKDAAVVNISFHIEGKRSPSPFSHLCPKFHTSSPMPHWQMANRLCLFAINESLQQIRLHLMFPSHEFSYTMKGHDEYKNLS